MVQTRYQAQFNKNGKSRNTLKSVRRSPRRTKRIDKENENVEPTSDDLPLLNICRSRETSAELSYKIENLVEQLDE